MTPNEFEFLENQLMTTSRAIQYPPTPDLASGFWSRLTSSPVRKPIFERLRAAGLVTMGVMAVLAVAITVISPARDATADLLSRINIFETDRSTEELPTVIPGNETTLEQAETALGARILQPSDESFQMERVLLQNYGGGSVVAVLFYKGDGLTFALFASNTFAGKGIPLGGIVDVEPVAGLGNEAYWLEGRRIVQSLQPNGDVITGSERVTDANALIWNQDGYVYRIEGDLEKEQAIAIAKSVAQVAGLETLQGRQPRLTPLLTSMRSSSNSPSGALPVSPPPPAARVGGLARRPPGQPYRPA